jgi:inner membrane protein
MDSVTQAALGCAVAYGCWHRQLGRRAIAWGLVFGTLPDLDIALFPWLDPVQRLLWHRGESHSLWAMVIGAMLFAPLLVRIHRDPPPPRRSITPREAFVGLWLIFSTHVLIDLFNVYGTQLLAPFSRHGFGLNNLFIIDPLYTAPLILGILLALVLRTPRARHLANITGLALSTLYVGWSVIAQTRAAMVFAQARANAGLAVSPGRSITSPTPLNTLLWRHIAEVEDGFVIGYWSWLDRDNSVRFEFIPRGAATLAPPVRESRAFGTVEWFSQGFWAVFPASDDPDTLVVADLRFNELRPGRETPPTGWVWPFAWRFPAEPAPGAEIPLDQSPADYSARSESVGDVWRRLRGDRDVW